MKSIYNILKEWGHRDPSFEFIDHNKTKQNIRDFIDEKTIIMISHRFSALSNCDKIYITDDNPRNESPMTGKKILHRKP